MARLSRLDNGTTTGVIISTNPRTYAPALHDQRIFRDRLVLTTVAAASTVHRIVSNLPFGKQVGSHDGNTRLYPELIKEIGRTLHPAGRAVLLTEDKQLLIDSVQRARGLKIIRQRLLRYGGASPTAYTIARTRSAQRTGSRRPSTSASGESTAHE